jgi:hypothetical protein
METRTYSNGSHVFTGNGIGLICSTSACTKERSINSFFRKPHIVRFRSINIVMLYSHLPMHFNVGDIVSVMVRKEVSISTVILILPAQS